MPEPSPGQKRVEAQRLDHPVEIDPGHVARVRAEHGIEALSPLV